MEEVKVMTAHQALLLEMLKDFDAVCRRHHISYQLFAGTALGPSVTTASSRGTTMWM